MMIIEPLRRLRIALGKSPGHCRTCGLLKKERSKQAGYTTGGKEIWRKRFVCPHQSSTYAFDSYGGRGTIGVSDPTDCHGMSPWSCPHEWQAWREERVVSGSCPYGQEGKPCPDQPRRP